MSSCVVLGPLQWTAVPDSTGKQTAVEKALNSFRLFWGFFGLFLVFFLHFESLLLSLCAAPDVSLKYHISETAQSQKCLKFLQLQH